MCGILGYWERDGIPDEAVTRALDALAHRGPDEEGRLSDGPVGLGMRRLSIIDLEGGSQPQTSADGRLTVITNGEIYNYLELREELHARGHRFATESDTEVLLHLYARHGRDLCEHLQGMYAFALWDRAERTLLLARDRFGQRPLYHARTPSGGLIFASELKALLPLLSATGGQARISDQSLYHYLSLGVVPQPRTIYEDVHSVEPASTVTFDGSTLAPSRYWQLDFQPKHDLAYPDVLARTRALIGRAVELRLRSDVPVGVFLSGGIDSSIVALEVARQTAGEVTAFTASVSDETLDEAPVARRTAKAFGLPLEVLPLEVTPLDELQRLVRHYDQPYADSSAIPSMAISRLAAAHVKVALNGDGGDELFAGYRRYQAARWADRLAWLPAPAARVGAAGVGRLARRRRSALGFAGRFLRGMALQGGARYLAWTTDFMRESEKERWWSGPPCSSTEALIDPLVAGPGSAVDHQLRADHELILLSDLLVKMDMASMAASLEARSPFLDHELAEFAARIPDGQRLEGGRPKSVLRDAYATVLPDEVVTAGKRGFEVPVATWLDGDLRELLWDTLGAADARVNDIVDPSLVSGLLDGTLLRDRNVAQLKYALLVLELWLRQRPTDR